MKIIEQKEINANILEPLSLTFSDSVKHVQWGDASLDSETGEKKNTQAVDLQVTDYVANEAKYVVCKTKHENAQRGIVEEFWLCTDRADINALANSDYQRWAMGQDIMNFDYLSCPHRAQWFSVEKSDLKDLGIEL